MWRVTKRWEKNPSCILFHCFSIASTWGLSHMWSYMDTTFPLGGSCSHTASSCSRKRRPRSCYSTAGNNRDENARNFATIPKVCTNYTCDPTYCTDHRMLSLYGLPSPCSLSSLCSCRQALTWCDPLSQTLPLVPSETPGRGSANAKCDLFLTIPESSSSFILHIQSFSKL